MIINNLKLSLENINSLTGYLFIMNYLLLLFFLLIIIKNT